MTEEQIQQFDRFYKGEMQASEAAAFELRLQRDPDFNEAYASYLEVITSIEKQGEIQLRQSLDQIHTDLVENSINTKSRHTGIKWRPLYVAASVALIAAITMLIYPREESADALCAEYLDAYPITTTRSSGDASGVWEKFRLYYETEHYKEGMSLLDSAGQADTLPAQAGFYKGICLLHIQPPDPSAALTEFSKVLQNPGLLKVQTQWYCAMANLQLNRKTEAVRWLKEVLKDGN
ncbi:MAG: hypothetical protein JNM00_02130, partial [Flavobacteriales bacterium]|nr:hypothetical protein [Flavobacteriales bacterium]